MQDYGLQKKRAEKFFKNKDYLEFSRGRMTEKGFYNSLIKKHLKFELTFKQVKFAHDYHLHDINEEVRLILKELNSKHEVAIVTNTNKWQTERVKKLIDLTEYSERIFCSNEMGMLKTDDGCFPFVLKELGIRANKAILIDDKLANIKKAKEYGINGLLYKNPELLMADLKSLGLL